MSSITEGEVVTVSCAEGDTCYIYAGELGFEHTTADLNEMPPAPLKIMMNVGNPERAFDFAQLPHQGIGLARLEFVIARQIKSEEHTSELQSLMRNSSAVFC